MSDQDAMSQAIPEYAGWFGADPDLPGFKLNPHGLYRHLRETAPVNLTPNEMWRLTRYEDIQRLLKHTPAGMRDSEGLVAGMTREESDANRFILQMDPPDHDRIRRLVSKAFTPPALTALRPLVQQSIDQVLEQIDPSDTTIDVVPQLALPVPAASICAMLGVPFSDKELLSEWVSLATFRIAAGAYPEMQEKAAEALQNLIGYMMVLIEERRKNPTEDILGALVSAEEEGDRLDIEELVFNSIGLLIAGLETTIGLIGHAMRCFARFPDQWELLYQQPELLDSAIEECLRFEPSVPLTIRTLHEDTEFGGIMIPKDNRVMAVLIAGNRDPAVFSNPDNFDITRNEGRHCSFGGGIHFCLGSHLARLNTEIALSSMVSRFTNLQLNDEDIEWAPSLFRIPSKMPLQFTRR
ncbi:MAG: cytochrome P450 [Halioglobus sp.]